MLKRILGFWYVWLGVIAIVIVSVANIPAERRAYMTAEEYENITEGMTKEALFKVTEAKPNQDTRYIGNDLYVIYYWGDKEHDTEVSIALEQIGKDKYIVSQKDKRKLPE